MSDALRRAGSSSTSAGDLAALARHEDEAVRRAVARNGRTPRAALLELASGHHRDLASRPDGFSLLSEALRAAFEAGSYGLIEAVRIDDTMDPELRRLAEEHRWSLDHQPAGPEHRQFLRIYGAKSIDDIDD